MGPGDINIQQLKYLSDSWTFFHFEAAPPIKLLDPQSAMMAKSLNLTLTGGTWLASSLRQSEGLSPVLAFTKPLKVNAVRWQDSRIITPVLYFLFLMYCVLHLYLYCTQASPAKKGLKDGRDDVFGPH